MRQPDDPSMAAVAYAKAKPRHIELWWVRPVYRDHCIDDAKGHIFAGDERAMARHLNRLHRASARMHAARRIEP